MLTKIANGANAIVQDKYITITVQKKTIEDNIANFQRAIREDDNANFRGTAWGMINAYSDFLTHPVVQRETKTMAENNFIAVTFDPRPLMAMLSMVNRIAA